MSDPNKITSATPTAAHFVVCCLVSTKYHAPAQDFPSDRPQTDQLLQGVPCICQHDFIDQVSLHLGQQHFHYAEQPWPLNRQTSLLVRTTPSTFKAL